MFGEDVSLVVSAIDMSTVSDDLKINLSKTCSNCESWILGESKSAIEMETMGYRQCLTDKTECCKGRFMHGNMMVCERFDESEKQAEIKQFTVIVIKPIQQFESPF